MGPVRQRSPPGVLVMIAAFSYTCDVLRQSLDGRCKRTSISSENANSQLLREKEQHEPSPATPLHKKPRRGNCAGAVGVSKSCYMNKCAGLSSGRGVVGSWGCGDVGLWGCGVVGLWGCGVVGWVVGSWEGCCRGPACGGCVRRISTPGMWNLDAGPKQARSFSETLT